MRALFAVLMLCAACVGGAEPNPAYVSQLREIQAKAVEKAEASLEKLKKELLAAKKAKVPSEIKRLNDELKAAPAALKALKEGDRVQWPALPVKLEPGAFGKLDSLQVQQVLGPDKALVEVLTHTMEWSAVGNRPVSSPRTYKSAAILSGVDTAGWTDGAFKNDLGWTVEFAGTESYVAVSGAKRTVAVLKPLPADAIADLEAAVKPAKKGPAKPAAKPEATAPAEVEVDGLGQPIKK